MVVVSYSGKEINAKLVYYGAGLSGKTTNLESIYEAVPEQSRGKMVSMKTQSDRTLFFDLLPLDLGEIMGFKTRFLLYTVPGQVFYNATRKLVLKGADAIVFVADSEQGKMDENRESIGNLRANLAEYGLKLEEIPWVIQYNKRDLPNVYSVEELNRELNPDGSIPTFEAVATQGKGVFETFRGISHLLMNKVTRELRRGPLPAQSARAVKTEEPAGKSVAESKLFEGVGPAAPVVASAPATPAVASAPAQASDAFVIERPSAPFASRVPSAAAPAATPAPQPARSGSFEYGRELTLPGDPVAAPSATPAPAHAAHPASSGHKLSPLPAAVFAPSPARPAVSAPASASAPAAPAATPAPAPSTTPTTAGSAAAEEIVLPVTLPADGRREIVLRIVISDVR